MFIFKEIVHHSLSGMSNIHIYKFSATIGSKLSKGLNIYMCIELVLEMCLSGISTFITLPRHCFTPHYVWALPAAPLRSNELKFDMWGCFLGRTILWEWETISVNSRHDYRFLKVRAPLQPLQLS